MNIIFDIILYYAVSNKCPTKGAVFNEKFNKKIIPEAQTGIIYTHVRQVEAGHSLNC